MNQWSQFQNLNSKLLHFFGANLIKFARYDLKITVLHKTRGGKGKWSTIDTMELIRVTKGIGKRLRLDISSSKLQSYQWENLSVRLYDLQGDSSAIEKNITMDTRNIMEESDNGQKLSVGQVELKVYDLCKNLQFHVSYVCPFTNCTFEGKSNQFSTHDSGKQRKKSPSVNVNLKELPKKPSKEKPLSEPIVEPETLKHSPTYSGYSSPSRSTSCEELSEESYCEITTSEESKNTFVGDNIFEPILSNDFINSEYEDNSLTKKRKVNDVLSIQGFPHFCDGSLDVNGVIRAQNFLQYSDVRFKTNIEDIGDALNIVSSLQGKKYQWRSDADYEMEMTGGKKVIGLIAQEVRKILPEAVHEDDNGYLSINYSDIVPILIEALKQHIKSYQSDHVLIKQEIRQLHEKINSLSTANKEEETWSIYSAIVEMMSLFSLKNDEASIEPPTIQYDHVTDRTFTASSLTFPAPNYAQPPPTENVPKVPDELLSAPIRMINCITGIAKGVISQAPKESPKPQQVHTIYRSCDVKATLTTPGFSNLLSDPVKAPRVIQKAVIVSVSGWLLWSKSHSQGLERSVADSQRESLQMCLRAVGLLEKTYPGIDVQYFSMEMKEDVFVAVEDLCYEVFKQQKGADGKLVTLQERLEDADLVWFLGHSQGTVPSVMLCDRLIKTGTIVPSSQIIGILSMGGMHRSCSPTLSIVHPNPLIAHNNHIFLQKKDFVDYKEALKNVLEANVAICNIGAYKDSLVELSSSMMDFIDHPNILRSLMVYQEFKTDFEPQHTFKKSHNFLEELILLCLEMKNKNQHDINALNLADSDDLDYDLWVKHSRGATLEKLQKIIFDQDTPMPTTFAGLFYEIGLPITVFSTWGFKFHKITKYLKEGVKRHYQIPYLEDSYRLGLEWMLLTADSRQENAPAILRNHADDMDLQFIEEIKNAKKLYSCNMVKLESSFKYWKPTIDIQVQTQRAIHERMGWTIRQSFFDEYVDGFAELVAQEKEKTLLNQKVEEELQANQ